MNEQLAANEFFSIRNVRQASHGVPEADREQGDRCSLENLSDGLSSAFERCQFTVGDTTKTIDDVRTVLVNVVAAEAAIQSADLATDQTFSSLGLDSMSALTVGVEIEERLGLADLPVNLLWDYPTIDDLVEALWRLMNSEPEFSAAENM
jgi:acyl carrier protein